MRIINTKRGRDSQLSEREERWKEKRKSEIHMLPRTVTVLNTGVYFIQQ